MCFALNITGTGWETAVSLNQSSSFAFSVLCGENHFLFKGHGFIGNVIHTNNINK